MARATQGEAFLFYFERWRGSRPVQRMTFAERGIFLEMLIEQWMRGDLPDSPRAVADAIATSDAQAAEIETSWPALRRQFMTVPDASDRMQNLPLEDIRRERRRWLKNQQHSGSRGGSKAAANRRHEKEIDPAGSLQANSSDPIPNNTTQHNDELSRTELKREEPRAHANTVFEGSLPRDHRSHVFCDQTFSICVPAAVHSKLLNAVSRKFDGDRARAHTELLAWYGEVARALPAETVMGDAFQFWQPRFDAVFATPAPTAVLGKQTTRLASALVNIKRGAQG